MGISGVDVKPASTSTVVVWVSSPASPGDSSGGGARLAQRSQSGLFVCPDLLVSVRESETCISWLTEKKGMERPSWLFIIDDELHV